MPGNGAGAEAGLVAGAIGIVGAGAGVELGCGVPNGLGVGLVELFGFILFLYLNFIKPSYHKALALFKFCLSLVG